MWRMLSSAAPPQRHCAVYQQRMHDIDPPTTVYAKGLVVKLPLVLVPHRALVRSAAVLAAQQHTVIRYLTGQVMKFKLASLYTRGCLPPPASVPRP